METSEPQPSEERHDPTAEGECRVDMPMKSQIDEIVIEGVNS